MKHLSTVVLTVFILGCSNNSNNVKDIPVADSLHNVSKQGNKTAIHQPDSLEQAYMDGQYFSKSFIRLKKNDNAFIYLDSGYVANFVKDKKIQELFFQTKTLTPKNREQYYKQIISGIPKEDILIHKIVWSIDEIKEDAKGFDGGYHSVFTWLTHPGKQNPYYHIEVKRDYYDALRATFPISRLEIDSQNHKIFICNAGTEEYFTLDKWRELQKVEGD